MDGLIFNWNFSAVRKVSRWSQEGCRALKWTNALAPLLSLVHMLGNNCHLSSNKLFSFQTFTAYAGIFSRKILLCILCFWKVQLWEKSTKCPGVAKLEKLWKCCAGNWNFAPDGCGCQAKSIRTLAKMSSHLLNSKWCLLLASKEMSLFHLSPDDLKLSFSAV